MLILGKRVKPEEVFEASHLMKTGLLLRSVSQHALQPSVCLLCLLSQKPSNNFYSSRKHETTYTIHIVNATKSSFLDRFLLTLLKQSFLSVCSSLQGSCLGRQARLSKLAGF